ncbi:fibrinogen-like protein 1 [Amphiura filiformis]|uniref:fibrinogen-like protein 1 n=1 Tax=Amphiura filiformis TaxID=82378 RepID=UPI003B21CCB7
MGGDTYNLRVRLFSFNGTSRYQQYDQFRVHKGDSELELKVAGAGSAGDGLKDLNTEKFSTYDDDNDGDSNRHIADEYQSGWWFKKELGTPLSNLNGVYYRPEEPRQPWHGIIWVNDESLMETKMKIRLPLV